MDLGRAVAPSFGPGTLNIPRDKHDDKRSACLTAGHRQPPWKRYGRSLVSPAVAVVPGLRLVGRGVARGRPRSTCPYGAVGLPAARWRPVSEVVVGSIGESQRVIMLVLAACTYRAATAPAWPAPSTLKRWGVKLLLQTNASGSLRHGCRPA